jgi:hypothetical protein
MLSILSFFPFSVFNFEITAYLDLGCSTKHLLVPHKFPPRSAITDRFFSLCIFKPTQA